MQEGKKIKIKIKIRTQVHKKTFGQSKKRREIKVSRKAIEKKEEKWSVEKRRGSGDGLWHR